MATTVSSTLRSGISNKRLNIFLWFAQGILAAGFGIAGLMKLTLPIYRLAAQMDWAGEVSPALVRFIGLAELAAAAGLVLPGVTGVYPRLTRYAAAGLVLVMLLAMGFHIARGEFYMLPINVALASTAAFVVWGRAHVSMKPMVK